MWFETVAGLKGDLVDEIHTRTESQRFGERRALMVRTRPLKML